LVPYRVRNLGPDRLRQAYSLVQAVHPRLSLEAWRRYARSRLERRGTTGPAARRGILSLENQHGCILALYAFRVEPDLLQGRALRCEYLAAVDLLNPRQALRALIEAICQRAHLTGCTAIRIATPHNQEALVAELAKYGFAGGWGDYGLAVDAKQQASAVESRMA
jgi:hypothetical protein